ncbi:MAG TPA: TonB-dependent receptor [Chitinophagaceae bacterium]|jgi:hypothetical protein|nr:TonB-dependent receptor [Chitinophagaceae bacterium]
MKTILLAGFLLFSTLFAAGQHVTVTAIVRDPETRAAVQGATVLLRSVRDTTRTETTFTDTAGRFSFTGLAPDSFTLRISSVGFETLQRSFRIDSTDTAGRDLGTVLLPRSARELTGVTVTGTTPPAVQRGDTIQFNASQFKVNPDATAEDLARKIPGITVENGQVQAQGENVRRVTIDGRELFGEDATAALRNLPAEVIDKIQVFDRLSDQSRFTGFDDGNSQKEINIVTRANMRNGQFGRVFGGYGTDDRYQAGGNATFFKGNRRISVVGLTNNINQQNFSTQDLLGVTSNAQRGGGGGGPRGGGGGPRGGGGGRPQGGGNPGGGNAGGFGSNGNFLVGQQNGINRTHAFGINYADRWGTKAEVSGSYFYNNSRNNTEEAATRQYFQNNFPNLDERNTAQSDNLNHRVNLRIEYRIDSANQIIFTPSLSFQDNQRTRNNIARRYFADGTPVNEISNNTLSNRNGYNLNNTLLYRHSFAKRGRTISVNLNTSANNRAGEVYQNTLSRIYEASGETDSAGRQFTDQANNGYQVSTNLVYTEPLGRNSQLQLNYNPSWSRSKADQEAFLYNSGSDKYDRFDTAQSNRFENRYDAQNAGIAYRYGQRDNQFSIGLNYQRATLSSDQFFPVAFNLEKSFSNVLPNAMARFRFSPRANIRLMYRANTNQPSVTQLQGVPDRTNAPFVTIGNPNLNQQYTHIFNTRYTFTNTTKGILFVGNVFAQAASNYITNATYLVASDSTLSNGQKVFAGEELTQPINVDGYRSLRSFLTFAVPLKFIRSNLNLNGGVSYNRIPGLVNRVANETRNMVYTLGTVVSSNVSEQVDFTVSYNANFNTVANRIVPERNDRFFQHVAAVNLNLLSKSGWFFQNDLNNQYYSGLAQGFNQSFFLWNMSAGKKLGKDRKTEIRLGVFDLLGQNRSIQRNVTETYIEDARNVVLQRYFLLTFSYNLRNFGVAAAGGRGGRN